MAETLILPACKAILNEMLVPDPSNTWLKCQYMITQLPDMSADIQIVLLEKMRISKKSALKLDELKDISGHSRLLANVRFVDVEAIRENNQQERGNLSGHVGIS